MQPARLFPLHQGGRNQTAPTRPQGGAPLESLLSRLTEADRTLSASPTQVPAGLPDLLREAGEALHASQQQLANVLEGALEAILVIGEDGRHVDANRAACDLFGVTRDEIRGRKVGSLSASPEEAARIWETFRARGRLRGETRILRPDGAVRDVEFSSIANFLPGLHLALLRDVTEPRLVEASLRASETRFRAVVENAWDVVSLVSPTGVVLYGSPAITRMLGYALDEYVGSNVFELVHPDDAAAARGLMERCLAGAGLPVPAELRFRHRDGSTRFLDVVGVNHLADPAVGAIVLNFHDETERKRAERELGASRAFLDKAEQVAHLGGWEADLTGSERIAWSPEVHRILGVSPEDFDGQLSTFYARVHPEDLPALRQAMDAAATGGRPFSLDHRVVRPDGDIRWVHSDGSVGRDEQGRSVRLIGIVQDITQRKQLEQQLVQSQKIEAVGRLAGGISHDFNNVLTAILGYSSLLLRGLGADDPARRRVEEIRKAGERAASLTRQLLAFSRQQMLMARVFDLGEVVEDLGDMLKRLIREDITLEIVRAGPGRVKADPGQVEQVIVNLVVNARDAMPEGGRLAVRVSTVDIDDAFVSSHPGSRTGPHVRLEVTDSGLGMDPETRRHIFEPFFTTKERKGGTGLGLATVYGIVKQSGGYVDVDSEPGRGTTFRVDLPRTEEPAERRVARVLSAPTGQETILILEDEDLLRTMVRETLEAGGYRVLAASSGEEAIALLRAREEPVHLLLTDVVMPGMSGREAAMRLAPLRPSMKVLYMSGYTDDAVVVRGVLTRGAGFLQKPFTSEALAAKVRQVLDQEPGA